MEKRFKYRMYGLTPYNISEIQKGIQFGHAVVEYGQKIKNCGYSYSEEIYNNWANIDKTFIILNGGTTNNSPEYYGTLQKYRDELKQNSIFLSEFREPDLNNALTAICFLVSEQVWDKENYPDFENSIFYSSEDIQEVKEKNYSKWVEFIGGEINCFLREFLKPLRLA